MADDHFHVQLCCIKVFVVIQDQLTGSQVQTPFVLRINLVSIKLNFP